MSRDAHDGSIHTTGWPFRTTVGDIVLARRPTLRDVAAHARVDASTVSRALNFDPRLSISAETRARILDAVRTLNYQPNANARRLRMARTMAIGYLIPDLVNPANGPLVAGVQKRARSAGYAVLIGSSADSDGTADAYTELLGQGRVDGLLVNCGVLDDAEVLSLASSTSPVVLVNRSVEGARASVVLDDEAAAQTAAEHLCDLGHRDLLHLAGPAHADTSQRRQNGFAAAAANRGATVTCANASDWTDLAGYKIARRTIAAHRNCTAVFTDNVSIAVGTVAAAAELQRVIPDDLSVIAMHDVPLASHVVPPLTAVKTPLSQLGARSVDVLHAILTTGDAPHLSIVRNPAPVVIQRLSTAPPHRDRRQH